METAQVQYTGDLRTQAIHQRSGKEFITDAPTDNNGKGEAFSPTDLLATSLACCMITIMGIAANKHGIDFGKPNAKVFKFMESNPRRVAKVKLEIYMDKQVNFSEQDKQILETAGRKCPVALSLHPNLEQDVTFIY